MELKRTAIVAGLICALGSALPARTVQARPMPGLSTLDKTYLKDTAQSNMEEVRLEPVVLANAVNAHDRQMGRQMRRDHGKANAELKRLAARVGADLPNDISDDQKALIKKFSHLHGDRFTAAYKQEMIRDHTEDIAKTKREISLGQNPLVKASAQKNLLLLQRHLRMSKALPSSMKIHASRM